jgi:hypothetical protein
MPIWRYQDLAKLIWTLKTGCLWFARADCLGDPYEGSSTQAFNDWLSENLGPARTTSIRTQLVKVNKALVRSVVVNCWHMSEHESAAMWRLYAGSGYGVAIQSTISRLVTSFPEGVVTGTANDHSVDFDVVKYIDHHRDPAALTYGPRLITDPFFLKRKSFEHEREFRAVIADLPFTGNSFDWEGSAFPNPGVAVPVDLGTLISAVHVAPSAAPWFKEVIESLSDKFGVRFLVKQSGLDDAPLF